MKAKLDRLAQGTQRSNSFLAARAIEAYVDRELEIVEGILRGIEDVKAGRVVPHEEAMAERLPWLRRRRPRKPPRSANGEAPGRLGRERTGLTSSNRWSLSDADNPAAAYTRR